MNRPLTPELVSNFIKQCLEHNPIANSAVFSTLRILKKLNPGDAYYEAYLGHYKKHGMNFVDYYHLLWAMGSIMGGSLQNVMEIGCRTGISICQLLSAMEHPEVPNVYLFDVFNDGFISPQVVKMNLKALNLPLDRVNFIVGDSLETVPKFVVDPCVEMDYILVDGCHDRGPARQDLENVVPLLRQSGILVFDDIAPDGCNLIDVWEDFKKAHSEEFFFHENIDGKGVAVGVKR